VDNTADICPLHPTKKYSKINVQRVLVDKWTSYCLITKGKKQAFFGKSGKKRGIFGINTIGQYTR